MRKIRRHPCTIVITYFVSRRTEFEFDIIGNGAKDTLREATSRQVNVMTSGATIDSITKKTL